MGANAAPGDDPCGLAAASIPAKAGGMNVRLRKLIGSVALIAFSLAYYTFAISVAIARLPDLATPWHILFYFVTVVIWFIPAAVIVRWIQVG